MSCTFSTRVSLEGWIDGPRRGTAAVATPDDVDEIYAVDIDT